MVWKCSVPVRYQLPRGISGGPALDFFGMMHRGGFGEVTRVGKTVVRPYLVPLAVPSASHAPVHRGIGKLVIIRVRKKSSAYPLQTRIISLAKNLRVFIKE